MVKFDPKTDIPSLSGKTILVTGGNIGLGRESVFQLAQHEPSKIILAARTKSKADDTIREVNAELAKSDIKASIEFLELDLTSFDSIKAAAKKVQAENDRLDILINNAGIMACPEGLTKEGYELQFGTNHMGHALFTKCLLPTLQKTAKGSSADVRVVFLSSAAEMMAPGSSYIFDKIKTPSGGVGTWGRYGQSKLANVHYTRSLAKKYPDIKFVSVHPGAVNTNLTSGPMASYPLFSWIIKQASWLVSVTVQQGAYNQLWAATSPDAKTGIFYWPVGLEGKDSKLAKNDELADKLWTWTEKELEGHDLD